ncbi:YeiH family protein [Thiopseudomonas alkaliphila]|uniref:YeiH family protein n=1 Tax=Thiopseudomonas alkaliphila TaxID=1697053 RepID=UPI00069CEF50|nr:putative sulfate exporter family transporter [Thiopseudomonas alkaliphila]AKX50454.1 hypothetical protein AKN92_02320 [Thiopseudomonas alkaliphila]AKX56790.1 hypothetical protein AKN89_02315 [Thiopseudomonas alkaliphila]
MGVKVTAVWAKGSMLSGILLAGALAIAASLLSQWPVLAANGLGVLTVAVILGMLLGNLLPNHWHSQLAPGLNFSKQRLLRIGVALFGLRLSLSEVLQVGIGALVVDALMMLSTIVLAIWLGTKLLRLSTVDALLIGSGHAVCGAAAVLACSGMVKAKDNQVAIAVACVVVFGTLSMLLYPWLYQLQLGFFADDHAFGVFTGATVHEVAQVVAIGTALPEATAQAALVSKLIRVLLLAPFILLLGWWWLRRHADAGVTSSEKVQVPMPVFVFGFIACMLLNTWFPLSLAQAKWAYWLDDLLLATAMAALGLGTRWRDLKQAGIKPLLLAAALTLQLMLLGALTSSVIL